MILGSDESKICLTREISVYIREFNDKMEDDPSTYLWVERPSST